MTTLIAIDGYAGSGKTTIARMVSRKLHFDFLDTGVMYRIVALWLFEKKLSMENKSALLHYIESISFSFQGPVLCVGEQKISSSIYNPSLTPYVMQVAEDKEIREILVRHQRKLSNYRDMILVGRDVTSVVCPHADYRYFFKADLNIRAQRRYQELKEGRVDITLDEVIEELRQRDQRDSRRKNSPLVCLQGVKEIDTSNKSKGQIMDLILFDLKNNNSAVNKVE